MRVRAARTQRGDVQQRRHRGAVAIAAAFCVAAALSGVAHAAVGRASGTNGVIRVPRDVPTIQRAVNTAQPGQLVLIAPGVYHEAVTVASNHRNIEIRGEDRATEVPQVRAESLAPFSSVAG